MKRLKAAQCCYLKIPQTGLSDYDFVKYVKQEIKIVPTKFPFRKKRLNAAKYRYIYKNKLYQIGLTAALKNV